METNKDHSTCFMPYYEKPSLKINFLITQCWPSLLTVIAIFPMPHAAFGILSSDEIITIWLKENRHEEEYDNLSYIPNSMFCSIGTKLNYHYNKSDIFHLCSVKHF